jgi:pilus assembly protein CpaB
MKLSFINLKFNKTWIVFGVALSIGLLAALAARNYLSGQMAAIEARSKGTQVNVVVAKRELKRGEALSSESVAIRPIPIDYAHNAALRPDEFERFDGQVLAFGAKPGEMILWSMLEGKKVPTFSARVGTGHRAITVAVDEINSISGLLEPGDRVDLMVTLDNKGTKYTVPLLQAVQVMATGQRSADDPKTGERRQYSTVTLDTTPEQAHNVIVAREAGRITALLRNPTDTKALPGGEFDLAAVLGRKGEELKAVDSGVRQVPVLYGGRSATLPVEGLQLGQYVHASTGPQRSTALLSPPSTSAPPSALPVDASLPSVSPVPTAKSTARHP